MLDLALRNGGLTRAEKWVSLDIENVAWVELVVTFRQLGPVLRDIINNELKENYELPKMQRRD